ncbi:MAG: ferredoxin [Thermoplasmata archaeon HGW-Thermoplasmata-1]|nr:MAG: ferredoxin [Thermoplasmata archaeon HGW-Thermoplasmata-1]
MKVIINGKEYSVGKNDTVLEACRKANINIPTLCHSDMLTPAATCRICTVEANGKMVASCVQPVTDGMEIKTNTSRVMDARMINLQLLMAGHDDCTSCGKNRKCDLQRIAEEMGVRDRWFTTDEPYTVDMTSLSIVRDTSKCILCGKCVRTCREIQTVEALAFADRSVHTKLVAGADQGMGESVCINCGQCILACPTGALSEVDETGKVWDALNDPNKFVGVQTAPAIRAAIGEEFGLPAGSRVTGKMVAALRRVGFNKVFDTDFTADLTILEEGTELLGRIKNGGKLPMFTSCSPGWIKFIETFYPDLLENLSTCKSPQQMFGALAKTYLAEKLKVKPENMFVVSIMPCTAKKFECGREEMTDSGYPDVDVVLTTREAARLIKQVGVDFVNLPDEQFDHPLGESTGAAVIFGATGGVMEAALRTVYEVVTKSTLPSLDFVETRGMKGVKEATVMVGDLPVKVAIANGTGNARKILDRVRAGKADYHFVEIMACPGGCLGGGGQPIPTNLEIREKRMAAIYEEDANMELRKSHENPYVAKLYKEFLGEPNSHKAHELLHTHYLDRKTGEKKVHGGHKHD